MFIASLAQARHISVPPVCDGRITLIVWIPQAIKLSVALSTFSRRNIMGMEIKLQTFLMPALHLVCYLGSPGNLSKRNPPPKYVVHEL
jgi:hypothetical protein